MTPAHPDDDADETKASNLALFERASRVTPGGVNSPVRAFKAVGGTPYFAARGEGAYVTDVEGKPGCYKAVVFLKPHFQLDELTVSIRLVAELPPPAAA